jgi:hypothetical protein
VSFMITPTLSTTNYAGISQVALVP